MNIIVPALAVLAAALLATSVSAAKTVDVVLNDLELTIDADTGSILKMAYPGVGTLLESSPDKASIVDMAYPVEKFEPLRLSSRFSRGVRIDKKDGEVTLTWDRMGASRTFVDLPGEVGVVVRLKAAPDKRSVIISCDIDNRSQNAIRQVMFPDFSGLLPIGGPDGTIFKTGAFGTAPFRDLAMSEARGSDQFATEFGSCSVEYVPGGMFHSMTMRWCDFGSLSGGFSLFPKRWGWDPQVPVRLIHSQTEQKIRMLSVHLLTIKPGEKWSSGEFVLTPHISGWAKGIEPFREWVRAHIKREHPVPKHVREGLGYRTVWMSQCQPDDPYDAVWKFSDLTRLAEESKEYGIDEMVLWAWCPSFELPLPGPYPHLGTEAQMVEAIAACRKLGVNVAPFISVLQAGRKTGAKYGLAVPEAGGWTQHTELIPQLGASYSGTLACAPVDTANEIWQKETWESCKHLIDIGIHSLSWDQFWSEPKTPSILTLTKQIRAYSRQRDPESTFSGEELWNVEIDSEYLDYTWNWGGWRDWQAYTSVFPAPRRNCCITWSAQSVKLAFMDNLYINVFPRKHDSVNGSDYIANYPELSKALKQCAKLRKQFLAYFTDGTLIGNCILSQPNPHAVTAYVLPDRVLMIIMNRGGAQSIAFNVDLNPWLKSESGKYEARTYNADGELVSTTELAGGVWAGDTAQLQPEELALIQFSLK